MSAFETTTSASSDANNEIDINSVKTIELTKLVNHLMIELVCNNNLSHTSDPDDDNDDSLFYTDVFKYGSIDKTIKEYAIILLNDIVFIEKCDRYMSLDEDDESYEDDQYELNYEITSRFIEHFGLRGAYALRHDEKNDFDNKIIDFFCKRSFDEITKIKEPKPVIFDNGTAEISKLVMYIILEIAGKTSYDHRNYCGVTNKKVNPFVEIVVKYGSIDAAIKGFILSLFKDNAFLTMCKKYSNNFKFKKCKYVEPELEKDSDGDDDEDSDNDDHENENSDDENEEEEKPNFNNGENEEDDEEFDKFELECDLYDAFITHFGFLEVFNLHGDDGDIIRDVIIACLFNNQ